MQSLYSGSQEMSLAGCYYFLFHDGAMAVVPLTTEAVGTKVPYVPVFSSQLRLQQFVDRHFPAPHQVKTIDDSDLFLARCQRQGYRVMLDPHQVPTPHGLVWHFVNVAKTEVAAQSFRFHPNLDPDKGLPT